ncbi:MAG TPA: nitronate monooxygenase [Terriglobales bacterium]|nr:nitronate monooxygenase [Terriglobales bacterium]
MNTTSPQRNWPDRRILDLFGIELPIIQAPMAGASTAQMAIEVAEAGGLGSLPCALMAPDQARQAIEIIRQATSKPLNLNFFCHTPPKLDEAEIDLWKKKLTPYYIENGIDPAAPVPVSNRAPFDDAYCALVETFKPEVVSFHFGLPAKPLFDRVRATGAKIIASATTVAEARWLEERGVDAIIAMGTEAGGHQGNFLSESASEIGLFALLPQIADAVKVPVIAAGGIGDGRGIAAAFILGASAVQIGTAYLFSPEAKVQPYHLQALKMAQAEDTALTNLFTGRPARGISNRIMREIGPMSDVAPTFPLAGGALMPLRAKSEPAGHGDFSNMWSGQAARLAKHLPSGELTKHLAQEALAKLGR